MVGLLAEYFLKRHKGETIVHDPRVFWCTEKSVMNLVGNRWNLRAVMPL